MHDHQSFVVQSAHAAESITSPQTHDGSGFLIVLLLLYFIPSIIAFRRHHHNRTAITALNVLLGWSVIGWIAALVWALTAVTVQANANGP
ncbi:superinfection immunity protein [Burkholderia sp. MS455]|uniref:superinfection immunity protein n=1 Tax=Burkholderia sp. MS455 TaxID=2811788 RepID=UPI00195A177F|nr:superinfection immunity protein [Burkholderia sp. MS455]QRR09745.1 superinfection immunity protein [Burkholderia sp. MS455]